MSNEVAFICRTYFGLVYVDFNFNINLSSYRAHTPRALCRIHASLVPRPTLLEEEGGDGLGRPGTEKARAACSTGTSDDLYQEIDTMATKKPPFRLTPYAYNLLGYLDVEIWRFYWSQRTTDYFIPCACARDNDLKQKLIMIIFCNNNPSI